MDDAFWKNIIYGLLLVILYGANQWLTHKVKMIQDAWADAKAAREKAEKAFDKCDHCRNYSPIPHEAQHEHHYPKGGDG